MMVESNPPLKGLKQAERSKGRELPPVHLWHPPYCGAIDMRIKSDGSWHYMGSKIHRPAMVRLFSTILRREETGEFVLVTPVERVGITVEDAPFVAVAMKIEGEGQDQSLVFTTNVEDDVAAGPDHAIRMEDGKPYLHVRARLEALIARSVYYDLVDLAQEIDGKIGIWSGGRFFPLGDTP